MIKKRMTVDIFLTKEERVLLTESYEHEKEKGLVSHKDLRQQLSV